MRAHRDELIQKGILLPDLANATSPTNASNTLSTIAGESWIFLVQFSQNTKRRNRFFVVVVRSLSISFSKPPPNKQVFGAAGRACSNINNLSPTIESKTCQQTTTTLPRHYRSVVVVQCICLAS